MPSIELGPLRPVGPSAGVRATATTTGESERQRPSAARAAEPAVARINTLDPGQPPVNPDRVAEVRKAIESGTYPIIPAEIADAIIAAGLLLRSGKQ